MEQFKIGKIIGQLETLISNIKCSDIMSLKDFDNRDIKNRSLELLKELQELIVKPQNIEDEKKYERTHKVCIDGVIRWLNDEEYAVERRAFNG